MKIAVIGGGLVGRLAAWAVMQTGHSPTIFDRIREAVVPRGFVFLHERCDLPLTERSITISSQGNSVDYARKVYGDETLKNVSFGKYNGTVIGFDPTEALAVLNGMEYGMIEDSNFGDLEEVLKLRESFDRVIFTLPVNRFIKGNWPYVKGSVGTWPLNPGEDLQNFCIYNCVVSGTRVLTTDLRWVPVQTLQVGDSVLSVDEIPENGTRTRRYKQGIVTHAHVVSAPTMKLFLASGKTLTCTPEHPWLHERRGWITTRDIQERLKRGLVVRLKRVFDVWDEDRSYEAGYLAAAFDGEGSVGDRLSFGFTQNDNEMRATVLRLLNDRGVSFSSGARAQAGQFSIHGRLANKARILGELRPLRLLANAQRDGRMYGCEVQGIEHDEVVAVRDAGYQEIVKLSVDQRTYITEGFVSHNSHPNIPWYRAGSMFGWAFREFPHEVPGHRVLIKVMDGGDTPPELENVLFVGRFGAWRKDELSHLSYARVKEWLS